MYIPIAIIVAVIEITHAKNANVICPLVLDNRLQYKFVAVNIVSSNDVARKYVCFSFILITFMTTTSMTAVLS